MIRVAFVGTDDNTADLMTKNLPVTASERHSKTVLNSDAPTQRENVNRSEPDA